MMMRPVENIDECFRGTRLYGDEFDLEQLRRWYHEEEYGYYNLSDIKDKPYEYHALNWWYGYRFLKGRQFEHCLALGASKADDILPLASSVQNFTIVEPAEQCWGNSVGGKPAAFIKPAIGGALAMTNLSVDLAISLGVLHHIANVSAVINEIGRVLRPGGLFVLREPIHSMGDWRNARRGLTRNERGIPPHIVRERLLSAGMRPIRWQYCMFAPLVKLNEWRILRDVWNRGWLMPVDQFLSLCFSWNLVYHRTNLIRKIAPHCLFIIAERF